MFLTIFCLIAIVFGLGMITYPIFKEWQWKHSKLGKHAIKVQKEIEQMCADFSKELEESSKRGISPERERMIEEGVNKALKPHLDEFDGLVKELKDVYDWNKFIYNKCQEYEKEPTPGNLQRIKDEIKEAESAKVRAQS